MDYYTKDSQILPCSFENIMETKLDGLVAKPYEESKAIEDVGHKLNFNEVALAEIENLERLLGIETKPNYDFPINSMGDTSQIELDGLIEMLENESPSPLEIEEDITLSPIVGVNDSYSEEDFSYALEPSMSLSKSLSLSFTLNYESYQSYYSKFELINLLHFCNQTKWKESLCSKKDLNFQFCFNMLVWFVGRLLLHCVWSAREIALATVAYGAAGV